ncbi:hypothetical protein XENORESO_011860, partial [Xenotaenia resolanae]
ICQEFNTTWAWELEQKGYKELSMECKTGILKYLCEIQFDENVKFKTAINDEDPDKMRLQPIGRDKDGQMYWFQLDQDDNVRVYVEEQDDLDGASWKCIVRTRNDLAEVVALLKTQIDPELLKKDLEQKSKLEGETDKDKGDTKKTEDTSDEDHKEINEVTRNSELKPEPKLSLNGVIEAKLEPELTSENVSTKAQSIKEEPVEAADSKSTLNEPALPCVAVKGEEVRKGSSEEIQHPTKNDQQAKIPLKKRGMKFSEDFGEKNGAITTQNLAVPESNPEQKIQRVNDQVNGEVLPQADKDAKEQTSKDKSRENIPPAADEVKLLQGESTRTEEKQTKNREAHKPSQELTSVCKDVEKSSNLEEKINQSKSADGKGSSTIKSTTVKATHKVKSDKLNHDVKSDESAKMEMSVHKSDSSETRERLESIKINEKGPAEEGPAEEKGPAEKGPVEVKDHAEEKKGPIEEKKKGPAEEKEKGPIEEKGPEEEKEKGPADKEPAEKPKATTLQCADAKIDTLFITDKSGERREPPHVKDKSESCKQNKKSDDIKEMSSENPKDVKKDLNCKNGTICDFRPTEEEESADKHKLLKTQDDYKTGKNSEHKTLKACEQTDEPSTPAEKKKASKETESEKKEKEEKKVLSKETTAERLSSENKKDANKASEYDSENKNISHLKGKDGDSLTDDPQKSEVDQETQKQYKTSTNHKESSPTNSSKDSESSKETKEKQTKGAASDAPAEKDCETKHEVVQNGGNAATEGGTRRRNKPLVHRRRAELQREERQGDSETDTNTGRCLRRSPRISRPSQKAVEVQEKKTEKPQAAPLPQKREDEKDDKREDEEETEVKTVQKKPKEKKVNQESQPKPKGRKRRRTRWSNTRTRRKKKNSDDEDKNSNEESSEEEESEEEDDSDEDYKVERNRKRRNRNRERRSSDSSTSSDDDLPPNDDPCKHCGLPNHPELVGLSPR